MTLKKALLGILVLIVALCIGGVVILFHTSIPLRGVAGLFEKAGVVTEGIDGSLASGLTIRKATSEGNSGRFVLKNFSLRYSGLYDLWVNRHLHIHSLRLDELEYIRKPLPPGSELKKDVTANTENENRHSSSDSSKSRNLNDTFKKITIDEVRVGRVAFILDGTQTPSTFVLSRFEIDGAESSGETNRFKRVTVDSNYLSFEIIPADSGAEGLHVSGIAKAVLSPYLLQDFPWKGSLVIQDHRLKDLSLNTFDGQLQAQKVGEQLQIAMADVTPDRFFRDTFPITSVNGNLSWNQIGTPNLQELTSSGVSIRLGQTVFMVPDGVLMQKLSGEQGEPESYGFSASGGTPAQRFILSFRMKNHVSNEDPSSYVFNLSTTPPMREDEMVAAVYFGKSFGKLTPEELATAGKAADFFKLVFPPPAPPPVAVKRPRSGRPSARKPAPRTRRGR